MRKQLSSWAYGVLYVLAMILAIVVASTIGIVAGVATILIIPTIAVMLALIIPTNTFIQFEIWMYRRTGKVLPSWVGPMVSGVSVVLAFFSAITFGAATALAVSVAYSIGVCAAAHHLANTDYKHGAERFWNRWHRESMEPVYG